MRFWLESDGCDFDWNPTGEILVGILRVSLGLESEKLNMFGRTFYKMVGENEWTYPIFFCGALFF